MTIDAVTASLIGTAIGAVAGIGGSLITTLITKRAEEKRHYRALAIQAALAHWQFNGDVAKLLLEKRGQFPEIPHFDVLLLQKLKLMEIVTNERLDTETIASKIRELKDFTDVLVQTTTPEKEKQDT
jgi:hypothetical protein